MIFASTVCHEELTEVLNRMSKVFARNNSLFLWGTSHNPPHSFSGFAFTSNYILKSLVLWILKTGFAQNIFLHQSNISTWISAFDQAHYFHGISTVRLSGTDFTSGKTRVHPGNRTWKPFIPSLRKNVTEKLSY